MINTKKGDKMAFLSGSDATGSMEYILFPKVYNLYQELRRGEIVKIKGTVEKRLSDIQIIVNKIDELKDEGNDE